MSQTVLWIWNGWGVLFILLGTLALLTKVFVPVRLKASPLIRDVTFWGWALGLGFTILTCGWLSGLVYCPVTIALLFMIAILMGSLRHARQ